MLLEAERIDRKAEIEAYVEVVAEAVASERTAIVVKPHPRDLEVKTRGLVEALERRFSRVALIADPAHRYLPFEVTVGRELTGDALPRRRFLTFSSACLALELLYGETTECGFGEERVRRTFHADFVETRLRHERDLSRALERVRRERVAGATMSEVRPRR